jgi:hypothetical protein
MYKGQNSFLKEQQYYFIKLSKTNILEIKDIVEIWQLWLLSCEQVLK